MQNPTGCATRQRLFDQYHDLRRQYTDELYVTGKQLGFDVAEAQMAELWEKCVSVRKELQRHEAEHRCMADAAKA